MKLTLKRLHFGDTYTIGNLYADDKFVCYTLEDKVREIANANVFTWKIQDKTAIPLGTYKISMTLSNRFKIILPLLHDVPGFTGVRIHTGNTSANTEGCILVGMSWDGSSDWIGSSKTAYSKLSELLDNQQDISITVV